MKKKNYKYEKSALPVMLNAYGFASCTVFFIILLYSSEYIQSPYLFLILVKWKIIYDEEEQDGGRGMEGMD